MIGSICSYRIHTPRDDSNLILRVNSITGNPVKLFVFNRDKFDYPIRSYTLSSADAQKGFNVSGIYYEFMLYVQPSDSGQYSFTAELEPIYIPKLVVTKPNKTNGNET